MNLYKTILYILLFFSIAACKKKTVDEDPNVFYTCSMDPQVMEKKPGKCPICKMELTKTVVSPDQDKESLKLSETQIKLGNVKFQKVESGSVGQGIDLRGTLAPDERKIEVISSRVPGRIDKLYFKNEGEKVNIGDKVYEIYSEELQSSINQYLLVKEKARLLGNENVNYKSILKSAKDKLIVFGLSESQISQLNSNSSATIPFFSKVSGTINEITLNEGDYVSEGSPIIKVSNLSSLWVLAEAYPQDLQIIKPGQMAKVNIEGFPNETVEAKISFENPELENTSKINLVRIEIANREGKYKPGMRATVTVLSKEVKGLTIPVEAILFQPQMNMVWITDGKGLFKPRKVETGIIASEMAEITSGLNEGEMIVVSGTYLIDSEYRLRNGAANVHEGHTPPSTPSPNTQHQH